MNMKIKSGLVYMSHKDLKAIKSLLLHSRIDTEYGDGGSFGCDNPNMEKDIKEAIKGADLIKFILKELVIVK